MSQVFSHSAGLVRFDRVGDCWQPRAYPHTTTTSQMLADQNARRRRRQGIGQAIATTLLCILMIAATVTIICLAKMI